MGEQTPLLADSHIPAGCCPREETPSKPSAQEAAVLRAINVSLWVNIVLFLAKAVAMVISLSMAVLASLLDSLLDLTSQGVIYYGHKKSTSSSVVYPAGRARLSPVGILVCSVLMFAGAVEVIRQSGVNLWEGFAYHKIPHINFSLPVLLTLLSASALKLGCYVYCRRRVVASDPDVQALAADHLNDILTNMTAVGCGLLSHMLPSIWFADSGGAILLSLFIAWCWYETGRETMEKLVGAEADGEHIGEISDLLDGAAEEGVEVDWLRVYHLGHHVVVEVEIVMHRDLPLHVTHDSAMRLQQLIERLDYVERCYVHVDYESRPYDEHKRHSFPFANPQSHLMT